MRINAPSPEQIVSDASLQVGDRKIATPTGAVTVTAEILTRPTMLAAARSDKVLPAS
jgi:hypothetical protein